MISYMTNYLKPAQDDTDSAMEDDTDSTLWDDTGSTMTHSKHSSNLGPNGGHAVPGPQPPLAPTVEWRRAPFHIAELYQGSQPCPYEQQARFPFSQR